MRHLVLEADGIDLDLADHCNAIIEGGQPDAALRFLSAYLELLTTLRNGFFRYRELEAHEIDQPGVYAGKLGTPFHAWSVLYVFHGDTVKVLAVVSTTMSRERLQRMMNRRIN